MIKWYHVLLLFLLLSACSKKPDADPVDDLSGTQGIIATSLTDDLEVYGSESFSLEYEIENKGTTDVLPDFPGYFYVSWDPWYLRFTGSRSRFQDQSFWLEGRKPFVSGERTFVTLDFEAYDIQQFSERASTDVTFTLCYPYTSKITQDVCIETTPRVDKDQIACKKTPLTPKTPGAPVIVSKIEVRNTRQSTGDDGFGLVTPHFRITINNVGGGIPSTFACNDDFNPSVDSVNSVSVRAFLLNEELDCQSSQPDNKGVLLLNNKAEVICSLPDDTTLDFIINTGNFQSLLNIELFYFYRESYVSTVIISR